MKGTKKKKRLPPRDSARGHKGLLELIDDLQNPSKLCKLGRTSCFALQIHKLHKTARYPVVLAPLLFALTVSRP